MSKKQSGTSARERSEQAKSARERARAKQNQKQSPLNMWMVIGGAIAVALIAVVISVIQSSSGVDEAIITKYQDLPAVHNVLGDPDAPVTIQVWEDFL